MSEPQKEKRLEKEILYDKYVFEIVEKEIYDRDINIRDDVIEITINGDKYTTWKIRDFDEILEHLTNKINVLKYILDDTYDAIAKDILFDIALILYKLSKNDTT
jgi:hypothetical protein